jgi:hypothetical protein
VRAGLGPAPSWRLGVGRAAPRSRPLRRGGLLGGYPGPLAARVATRAPARAGRPRRRTGRVGDRKAMPKASQGRSPASRPVEDPSKDRSGVEAVESAPVDRAVPQTDAVTGSRQLAGMRCSLSGGANRRLIRAVARGIGARGRPAGCSVVSGRESRANEGLRPGHRRAVSSALSASARYRIPTVAPSGRRRRWSPPLACASATPGAPAVRWGGWSSARPPSPAPPWPPGSPPALGRAGDLGRLPRG